MSPHRLVWSTKAGNDLTRIHAYIAFDKVASARRFVLRVKKAVERLRTFPLSGRVVPELARSDRRELIVDGYRIIYKIDGKTVSILTVFESHRQLDEL